MGLMATTLLGHAAPRLTDLHLGEERPRFERQGAGGCFPIVAWRHDGVTTWGVEAVMLSARAGAGSLRQLIS